eukprot:6177282-Pleurochrysis_carterae.AAC.3
MEETGFRHACSSAPKTAPLQAHPCAYTPVRTQCETHVRVACTKTGMLSKYRSISCSLMPLLLAMLGSPTVGSSAASAGAGSHPRAATEQCIRHI